MSALSFRVLLYYGPHQPPSAHLVTARVEAMALEIADVLLAESPGAVGVEVWCEDRRLYAHGEMPSPAD